MIEYVFEYLGSKGIYASNKSEQVNLEKGINLYLFENGIEKEQKNIYFEKYIYRRLDLINVYDLKNYFIMYQIISDVIQIVIEYKVDGIISTVRKHELQQKMKLLYESGLGEKYVPEMEIYYICNYS